MRAFAQVTRSFSRALKSPPGAFSLRSFIPQFACGQSFGGAPAIAGGLRFPPLRPLLASNSLSHLQARVKTSAKAPLPFVPSVVLSASFGFVSQGRLRLPLVSNRLRGSFGSRPFAPRPTRFPPAQALFCYRSKAGGLSRRAFGLGAHWWRSAPPL